MSEKSRVSGPIPHLASKYYQKLGLQLLVQRYTRKPDIIITPLIIVTLMVLINERSYAAELSIHEKSGAAEASDTNDQINSDQKRLWNHYGPSAHH